jgi:hypothetical protein
MWSSIANISDHERLIAEIVAASSYQKDGRPMPHAETTNATIATAAGANRVGVAVADLTG